MSEKDNAKKLDINFENLLESMKPYVIKLNQDKPIVSGWIKKLCHQSISSVTERKNRNLYAQILVRMLEKGNMQEPFLKKPTSGKLPTIPAYMSSFLDDYPAKEQKSVREPDWLQGDEFEDSVFSQTLKHESYEKYKDVLTPRKPERFLLSNSLLGSLSPMQSDTRTKPNLDNSDVNGIESYLNGLTSRDENLNSTEIEKIKYKSNPIKKPEVSKMLKFEFDAETKRNEDTMVDDPEFTRNISSSTKLLSSREKELELKLRLIEGRVQEETLIAQQKHDQMVQKILDRKNEEINELKVHFQTKLSELEDTLNQYEKKVRKKEDEIKNLRNKHTIEIKNVKDAVERKAANTASEYEKMMYDKLSDFETEIFNLQKVHRQNIEEIVSEADEKMKLLKSDCSLKNEELRNEVSELTKKLTASEEKKVAATQENKKLIKEMDELKNGLRKLHESKKEINKTLEKLKKENEDLTQEYDDSLKSLKKKSEETVDKIKIERNNAAKKAASIISELEAKIHQHQQIIQDTDLKKQRELKEQEAIHKQAILQLDISRDKEIRAIQSDFEKKEFAYQSKIRTYELNLKEKELETSKLEIKLQEHQQQTEQLIETFKQKAEENASNIYQDLNAQLEGLQESLSTAKDKIENQKNEFNKKIIEQKNHYEKTINRFKDSYEIEKSKSQEKHRTEMENLMTQLQQEKKTELLKVENNGKEVESKYKEQRVEYTKVISELEAQVRDLREQVIQANTLRKEQLKEVALLRDEEKKTVKRAEQSMLSKHRSEIEEVRLSVQKEHNDLLQEYAEKTGARLKDIESEYAKKAKEDQNLIDLLQLQIKEITAEHMKSRKGLEDELKQTKEKYSQEKSRFENERKTLQNKLSNENEVEKIRFKQLEKKFHNLEIESSEKVSRCRFECEKKLKGMLPMAMKKDLEETIDSMKQQIQMLQSRADILQEEVDASTKFSLSRTPPESISENKRVS